MLRHIRTTQETRANQDGPEERIGRKRQLWARGKRRNLPTSWDDIFVPTFKCWKKYRRTQYYVKEDA